MLTINNHVKVIDGLTPRTIAQYVNDFNEPVLLKNLVADWPIVKAATQSTVDADAYLRQFYRDADVLTFSGAPEINGRFFYTEDLSQLNFIRETSKLTKVLDQLGDFQNKKNAPSLYVGSTTIDNCLPGFREHNDLELPDRNPLISIWLGNQTRIAAHFDFPDNIACVVAGKRRFTLFPPEQLENLYVGPIDFTPAGQAISLVDFHNPDFERFPKFQAAIDAALVAELSQGDALFIPSMWWHQVEALDKFNVLINYWWRQSPTYTGLPIDVLHHAFLTLRELPPQQRKAWHGIFEYYIFNHDEVKHSHIPNERQGMLGRQDELSARKLRAMLLNKLNR